jgi:uncharacterized membrane protein
MYVSKTPSDDRFRRAAETHSLVSSIPFILVLLQLVLAPRRSTSSNCSLAWELGLLCLPSQGIGFYLPGLLVMISHLLHVLTPDCVSVIYR